ncbi:hypothetical protein ACOZ38_35230 [Sphaerisporangium viridialbum]|uniref:hypothetical protein n=1 Tax=Sphaerisporangium viridialbum TaxID=46189 RepID=UPI003C719EE2
MATVEIPDVPEAIVSALEAQALAEGLTLSAYLRAELERLATRPSNVEIFQRIAQRDRSGGPTTDEIVEQIRRVRDAS